MWSQLRDISIRVDEDAERGTPLNVSTYYAQSVELANVFWQKQLFNLVLSLQMRQNSRIRSGVSFV